MQRAQQILPHARRDGLVVQEMKDEVLVYDLERHEARCLNATAANVWQHCDGKTTVADMTAQLARDFNLPHDEEIVLLALDQLGRDRLLVEAVKRPASERISRRKMMRTAGIAAAVALPLITSIVAPTAVQAGSCLGQGASCIGSMTPCCPGLSCNMTSGTCQ